MAAYIVLAGLPIKEFLAIEDNFEQHLWVRVASRVIEIRQKIDQNRAILIANAVGKMLSGK